MKKKKTESQVFEKGMDNLKGIAGKLESGELTLDESLELFEEGVKQYRMLHTILENAQIKIETILSENKEQTLLLKEESNDL